MVHTMTKEMLIQKINQFVLESQGNLVSAQDAIIPDLIGMRMFDTPLVGFASTDDELFIKEFRQVGVIHPDYPSPEQWLPGAKTVVSFFLPFTETVRKSNLHKTDEPYEPGLPQRCSAQWLHARIEGQLFVNQVTDYIQMLLESKGFETVCPTTSGKHQLLEPFISNWSERHAAFAAGLGTFGLSKGLITEKGMAGRFGSVITNAAFSPTLRPYTDPFEYCIMCGACAQRCTLGAIDISKGCALGKDQVICGSCIDGSHLPPHGANQRVRYGCGKCQVGVPCESRIPQKRR